jgi:uncharacterized protein (TIGR03435 family)
MNTSPGRLSVHCLPLKIIIVQAYLSYRDGRFNPLGRLVPIEGVKDWLQSDLYTIEAKADGTPTEETMQGPMMQSLLEDRFQLKIHRETREVPVYDLVVARGGPRLQPFDGSCSSVSDFSQPSHVPGAQDCVNRGGASGPNVTRYWRGITIDNLIIGGLTAFSGRPVINKTGITGQFDIHLEFTPDRNSDAPNAGPSIFTAIEEQLGLKLVSAKGPGEFLIIDRVERPSGN